MRTRGSYSMFANTVTKAEKVVSNVEQNKVQNIRTKRKSSENSNYDHKNIKVITIDDSEDEHIRHIETITIEEFTSSVSPQVVKKCCNCLNRLDTTSIDYNDLTSADFYKNPRAHPLKIAAELRDRNRYNIYRDAINKNKHLFKGKLVLVVGSGAGLLALFAAKADAQRVLVIDSQEILQLIRAVLDSNKKNHDSVIEVLDGKSIEEVVLPNGIEKVDIIVSDWANHLMFYKSSIRRFIYARDKWLKRDGLVFPDSGALYISGGHDNIHKCIELNLKQSKSTYNQRIDWWAGNIYGFDMSAIRQSVLAEPKSQQIDVKQVVTNEHLLQHFDFYQISLEDINFKTSFELKAIENHYLQMFITVFEIIFIKNISNALMFSSRPSAPKTCFKPIALYFDNQKELVMFKGDKLTGNLGFSLNQDLNKVSINIDIDFENSVCCVKDKFEFNYGT